MDQRERWLTLFLARANCEVRLNWLDLVEKMRLDFRSSRRGYVLELSRDLLGDYVLRRHWFGLTNRRGGMKQQVFVEEEDAMREVAKIERNRAKHGYQPISTPPPRG